ncbi:NUDIX domain-containing protein [Caldisalinibacter kiritimatiensis]|uniref:Nudix hydrolase domain-containing protein n=1 Tax=Caldisalinibacter kiritimatiensis TaxID=1304284 RepID=R1CEZ2_9FIRM|nr:NUDIX domain-containing protein [Caldisalinibacter kiritimatiensis]EOD00875.1 hypothetical protein L21TH_1078 [Caldisalinibacter kiritimatiensis]
MDIIIVTAGIIRRKDKILIAQRKEGVNENLKWEFPGGKIEKIDRTPED